MTSTATHALRDRWFVSFLPLLTADMVTTEFKGDWKLASKQRMQRLDWVTTVEETWSTLNSLPKINLLGVGSTFIFSRRDKDPSFETFPSGSRLVVKLLRAPATEKGLEAVIAAVLGETVTAEATGGVPVCDVIRLAARPSREHPDLLRVEVWLNDAAYSGKVADHLRKTFRERDVAVAQYAIEETPFEAASPASAKTARQSQLSASSPFLAASTSTATEKEESSSNIHPGSAQDSSLRNADLQRDAAEAEAEGEGERKGQQSSGAGRGGEDSPADIGGEALARNSSGNKVNEGR